MEHTRKEAGCTSQRRPLRIAIVDNDMVTLMGLGAMLSKVLPGAQIRWTEQEGSRAVERLMGFSESIDVLLLDMGLSDTTGTAVCHAIRSRWAKPIIVGITSYSVEYYAERAAQAGAQGLIAKDYIGNCRSVIGNLLRGTPMSINVGGKEIRFETAQAAHERLSAVEETKPLSARESETLALYAKGVRPAEIAQQLGIASGTVQTLLKRVQEKWGVQKRSELIQRWWAQQEALGDRQ